MNNNKLLKLPGLVDVHVHMREPGGTQKEDFESGTMAAVAGGYTQILDMPNNTPPTDSPAALRKKFELAKNRIWCDLGFNFAGTKNSVRFFPLIVKISFGLKIYMNQTTGPLLIDKPKDRDLIFKSWPGPLPIMVHAEGETVKEAITFAKKYRKKIHICHVTADQLGIIDFAKKKGIDITCEVCPHHLFLSQKDTIRLGPLGVMKPPLLSSSDREKLWENIHLIDMISTDHAPHTLEEKFDKSSPKFGVPGLETTLPLLLKALSEKRLTIDKLIDMVCTKPRQHFRLPPQKNTYVEVDINDEYKIANKGLYTKCEWTPFVGLIARGKVKKVILRGRTIFQDGKFTNKPSGRVIKPLI